MKLPKQTRMESDGTHRLIPYRYGDGSRPVLNRLAEDDEAFLSDLTELEGATNDRLLGENGRLPGISAIELVSGFRFAHIVNAAFTHASPLGGRFNDATRGAWYAALELETAQQEVAFHRAAELREAGWTDEEVSSYIDCLADFRYEFHDIRGDSDFADCIDPDSYAASQALAVRLLTSGSGGVVYPSARRASGVCIACFRPPLVLNVREGAMAEFRFVNARLASVG
jgi:RES domain-containing protein